MMGSYLWRFLNVPCLLALRRRLLNQAWENYKKEINQFSLTGRYVAFSFIRLTSTRAPPVIVVFRFLFPFVARRIRGEERRD